jgi:lysozyme
MIKRHEGLRLKTYQCSAGHRTGGYGHNYDAHGEVPPEEITFAQAEAYFAGDLAEAMRNCNEKISYFVILHPLYQAVLVDMCFNMGINKLLMFKKMLFVIQTDDKKNIAREMILSRWAEQVEREAELVFMVLAQEWLK